jgi:hypothetical protein
LTRIEAFLDMIDLRKPKMGKAAGGSSRLPTTKQENRSKG